MPRVKIDYVVSFSSEDPEHPASNLLLREVSKKKWLCRKGETSCSVVLQLPRAVQISAVHIGVYHSALVEVLVGRSETSTEPFQVLVPSSVFVSREESRRTAAVQRVRSFCDTQLSAARLQRWDRLRLVCSQPYSKHCQFGLSFVHVDESAAGAPGAGGAGGAAGAGGAGLALPARVLALDAYSSSDDDDFRPGELFAQHRARALPASDTGAQIRQATSQALKNISESSTKLMKAHISKPVKRDDVPSEAGARRDRPELLYGRAARSPPPHAQREDRSSPVRSKREDRSLTPVRSARDDCSPFARKKRDDRSPPTRISDETLQKSKDALDSSEPISGKNKDNNQTKKRRRSNSEERTDGSAAAAAPHELLRGAVLVLSGYANPRRALVRRTALALGARLRPDWGPGCTHLICAFPNTPKLRAVRAAGAAVPAARAEWLLHSARRRRLLPWTWYATEPQHRTRPDRPLDDTPHTEARPTNSEPDSAEDTDDEIEKVLQDQKKRRLTESKPNKDIEQHAAARSEDSPYDASTDEEAPAGTGAGAGGEAGGALPDVFDGRSFVICAAAEPARRMQRYVRAYGGLVLQMSDVAAGSAVDYIVCGTGAGAEGAGGVGAARVSAGWLARCVAARALLPH